MSSRILLCGALLLLPGLAGAGERQYGAALHEANWVANSSRLECSLSHAIPFYGTASFSRKAGEELRFTLRVMQEPTTPQRARLNSTPPAWKHDAVLRDLGQVAIAPSKVPFTFERALSARLLSELEHGMVPTLEYRDWADGRDEVRVTLSSVNVRAPLDDFLQCLERLLPYDFNTIKFSSLHFDRKSDELDAETRRRLDQVAEYLLADETVKQVDVDAYTDSVGFRDTNRELTQKRAEMVRDYLVAKGIKPELLVLRSHGENDPKYSNRTERGRALNRRVTVSLVK